MAKQDFCESVMKLLSEELEAVMMASGGQPTIKRDLGRLIASRGQWEYHLACEVTDSTPGRVTLRLSSVKFPRLKGVAWPMACDYIESCQSPLGTVLEADGKLQHQVDWYVRAFVQRHGLTRPKS